MCFFPTLSGVGIQAAGGLTARITDSIYMYGEYDYANSDRVRISLGRRRWFEMAVVRAGFLRPKLGHRLHSTNFDSHLSGTVGRFGAGVTAKLSQAVYL
jgi:hypothetical protein